VQEQGGKCLSPSLGHPKEFAETFSDHQAERYRSFKLLVWGHDNLEEMVERNKKKRGFSGGTTFTIYVIQTIVSLILPHEFLKR